MQQPRHTLDHEVWVRDIAFLPSGDRLVSAAADKAYLWSLDDPKAPISTFPHEAQIRRAFALSADGSRRHDASEGREIKVWDLTSADPEPKPVAVIDVAGAWVMGLAFSPDGWRIASASGDNTFHVSPLRFDDLYETSNAPAV